MSAALRPLVGRGATRIAGRLLHRFQTLDGIRGATRTELLELVGNDAGWAHAFLALHELFADEPVDLVAGTPMRADDPLLHRWLRQQFAGLKTEKLLIVFGNEYDEFLHAETLAEGTRQSIKIPQREILRRAFELGAHTMIMAHNHPGGSARPSREDQVATERLSELGNAVGLRLIEHFVIGGRGLFAIIRGKAV